MWDLTEDQVRSWSSNRSSARVCCWSLILSSIVSLLRSEESSSAFWRSISSRSLRVSRSLRNLSSSSLPNLIRFDFLLPISNLEPTYKMKIWASFESCSSLIPCFGFFFANLKSFTFNWMRSFPLLIFRNLRARNFFLSCESNSCKAVDDRLACLVTLPSDAALSELPLKIFSIASLHLFRHQFFIIEQMSFKLIVVTQNPAVQNLARSVKHCRRVRPSFESTRYKLNVMVSLQV